MKELGSSNVFSVVAPVQAAGSKGLRRRSVANYSCAGESDFDVLVEEGAISPEDLDLITYVDDPQDAWDAIRKFYGLTTE
jgi:hypothetical protein